MYLIIGLGNPGKQYENTRHNAGFMAVDFLARTFAMSKFKTNNKFRAAISDGEIEGIRVILAKPQTYMNNSGEAVSLLKNYFKLETSSLVVIYDELDLPLGAIRVRQDGSSAGHNGIKSIMNQLTTDEFNRIRIGIRNKKAEIMPADKFVLSRFSWLEKVKLNKNILPGVVEEVMGIINS